jgi:hypothetical protein
MRHLVRLPLPQQNRTPQSEKPPAHELLCALIDLQYYLVGAAVVLNPVLSSPFKMLENIHKSMKFTEIVPYLCYNGLSL